jgi:hypothetical protein
MQAAAHVSAQEIHNAEGKLLMFSRQSAFAGQIVKIALALKSCRSKEYFEVFRVFRRIASDCTTVKLVGRSIWG